jgi:transcriptional regulator with PAS, ATPase and Fis domain
VAPTDADILILGENGTGKEVIARAIHQMSHRKKEIFLSADIAALSEGILESELFGHKKGSYTDAYEDRIGKFESASGGTLFLDEIGNLSLANQAKILTVLQTRHIVPIGTNKAIPVDIRLICATNSNLEKKIKEGSFREDLFYRINTVTISLPPLRERKEDIPALCNYYLNMYARKYGKESLRISEKTMEKLTSYSWRGNVRELRHCIEKAVILSDTKLLTEKDFQLYDPETVSKIPSGLLSMDELEKLAISRAIEYHNGNLTKVARSLKITRQTLYNKMKKHGL